MDSPDMIAKLDQQVIVGKMSSAVFSKNMAAEQARWGEVVIAVGIKGD